jgi:hypothetical protein
MVQLDPTKIKVDSHAAPIWEQEVTFQDMMAEQLRHAPWLVLSAALHAVGLVLLWILVPAAEKPKVENKAEMILQDQTQVEEPPPPPPPETKTEEVVEELVVTETTVTETEQAFDNVESEVQSKESSTPRARSRARKSSTPASPRWSSPRSSRAATHASRPTAGS